MTIPNIARFSGRFLITKPIEGREMKFWRVPFDSDVVEITKGNVFIIDDRCKGCGYCIEFCPRSILAFSTRFNRKGYHPPEALQRDECANCHYCEIICPEFAIYSMETDTTKVSG